MVCRFEHGRDFKGTFGYITSFSINPLKTTAPHAEMSKKTKRNKSTLKVSFVESF